MATGASLLLSRPNRNPKHYCLSHGLNVIVSWEPEIRLNDVRSYSNDTPGWRTEGGTVAWPSWFSAGTSAHGKLVALSVGAGFARD